MVRHKLVNTSLSHERLVGGLQDGGRGTHVTHFVQLYPQPLYTASQVPTTCRSWHEGVLTDVCLTGVLTDLCLTLYYYFSCITRARCFKIAQNKAEKITTYSIMCGFCTVWMCEAYVILWVGIGGYCHDVVVLNFYNCTVWFCVFL